MNKIVLKVEGMSCPHCEAAIQDAIRQLPGVKKAKVSLRKKETAVEYDASLISPERIAQEINETGYQATL
jgi:copper chaperone